MAISSKDMANDQAIPKKKRTRDDMIIERIRQKFGILKEIIKVIEDDADDDVARRANRLRELLPDDGKRILIF
jgi:hypothetical protein